jgi:hypothetical protein
VLVALAGRLGVPFDEGRFGSGFPAPSRAPAKTAFVPIWKRPWMTLSADTYGASLLAACGVRTAFHDAPARYPEVTLEEVSARRPDLVLLPSEPYPFAERHVAQLAGVAERVLLVDGKDLFWWGLRTPNALGRLLGLLTR